MIDLKKIKADLNFEVVKIKLSNEISVNIKRLSDFLTALRKMKNIIAVNTKVDLQLWTESFDSLRELHSFYEALSIYEKNSIAKEDTDAYNFYKNFSRECSLFSEKTDKNIDLFESFVKSTYDQHTGWRIFDMDLEDVLDFKFPDDKKIKILWERLRSQDWFLTIKKELDKWQKLRLENNYFCKMTQETYEKFSSWVESYLSCYRENWAGFGYQKNSDYLYIGHILNGKRHGRGLEIRKGELNFGEWKDNLKDGEFVCKVLDSSDLEYLSYRNDEIDSDGNLSRYMDAMRIKEKVYGKLEENSMDMSVTSALQHVIFIFSNIKDYRDSEQLLNKCSDKLEALNKRYEEYVREEELKKKEERKNLIINNVLLGIYTLICLGVAIPCLLFLNKWYMLLVAPVLCCLHSIFMPTESFDYWGYFSGARRYFYGARIWKLIFLGLFAGELICAIFVLNMPHNIGTAFYVILSFALAVFFEHLSEFTECSDYYYELGKTLKKWDWELIGRRALQFLTVLIPLACIGLVKVVFNIAFAASMWHLLWVIPCLNIAGVVLSLAPMWALYHDAYEYNILVVLITLSVSVLSSFIYATVLLCSSVAFTVGIFFFILLFFVCCAISWFLGLAGGYNIIFKWYEEW